MIQWWCTAGSRLSTVVRNPRSSSLYHTIQAIPRELVGKRASTRDTAQGRIPAVLFSEHFGISSEGVVRTVARKHLVTTERKHIESILKNEEVSGNLFCFTTLQLQNAGAGSSVLLESGTVLPVKAEMNASKNARLCNVCVATSVAPTFFSTHYFET